jgi:hypothetical protein
MHLSVCDCDQIPKANLWPTARCELIRYSRIEVPHVDYEKLSGDRLGERSEILRKRVQAARNIQQARFSNVESFDIVCNADVRVGKIQSVHQVEVLQYCPKLSFAARPRYLHSINSH